MPDFGYYVNCLIGKDWVLATEHPLEGRVRRQYSKICSMHQQPYVDRSPSVSIVKALKRIAAHSRSTVLDKDYTLLISSEPFLRILI